MSELIFDDFPGLDLRDSSGERAGADCMDVRFPAGGGVESRYGSEALTALASAYNYLFAFYSRTGAKRLIAIRSSSRVAGVGGVTVFDELGNQTFNEQTGAVILADGPSSVARFASPSIDRLYLADEYNGMRRYDTTSNFTNPAFQRMNALTGAVAAVANMQVDQVGAWPSEARMVYGGYPASPPAWSGTAVDSSMVWVSEPNDPELIRDSSFVRLGPGDGELVRNILAWRDLLFIFKERKFFVFTGLTVDAAGGVRFNRRAVEAGLGSVGDGAVAAGRDGLYFVSKRGIYRTTGGEPVCISDPISPLFGAERLPAFYTGPVPVLPLVFSRLAIVHDQLYWLFQDQTFNNGMLQCDLPSGRWAPVSNAPLAMTAFESRGVDELHGLDAASSRIVRYRHGLVGDALAATPWKSFYLSNFRRLAGGRVARVRQLKVAGAGTVDVGLSTDLVRTPRSEAVTLTAGVPGTARALAMLRANQYKAAEAAVYLGNTPAAKANERAWSVHRVVAEFGDPRGKEAVKG